MVVGSGTRFLSGISVYTVRLANAFAERGYRSSLMTMRQLLPARFYPGRVRVGASLTKLGHDPDVATFDGVDWYWLPSLARAVWFLLRQRPDVVILQWWTGTVLHTYIALALLTRLLGGRVVIEFHEVLDTGEVNIPLAHAYVRTFAPLLMGLANGFAVHSQFDREAVGKTWRLGRRRPIKVLPHGPHDHYRAESGGRPLREAPTGVINLLFFGVIRPFKGLEHLVTAFETLPEADCEKFWLTVVGETWEGWTLPGEQIARSPRRDRITFVNRYVSDEELDGYLRGADAVVLPYLRSSLSGPLHVAMGYGLPIVMSDVGGNPEAAEGYEGVVLVEPGKPDALQAAILSLPDLGARRYSHPRSWTQTVEAYEDLLAEVGGKPSQQ